MAETKTWILTDLAADTWVDAFQVGPADLGLSSRGEPWRIAKRTLHGGKREGVDLIEVSNGALSFSVLPTRGMGLWRGDYRGLALGWRPPGHGPVHPQFVNLLDRGGLGWLDGFDEWLCRCGLSSHGPPGLDAQTNEFLSLHGRIANVPAHYVEVQVDTEPPHELRVTGQVDEATLFFSNLRLTTTYSTTPGSNRLVIRDVIENLKQTPAELELLYHCQFGPPLLEAGSRIVAPIKEVAPRDARAAEGMASLDTCQGPTPVFPEQVYFYDLHADAQGNTLALLHNRTADKGMALRFNRAELPYFTVWKNSVGAHDGYVAALEPSTSFPNVRAFERHQGRVISLPPGGRHVATVTLEVLDSTPRVAGVVREVQSLQEYGEALVHHKPLSRWSPG